MKKKKKLLYLITEDWFFCSHFLERALAAKKLGFEIIVCSRKNKDKKNIEDFGFRFQEISFNRKSINPFYEFLILIKIINIYKRLSPDIVHHIAFKPIIYGSIAARINNIKSVVNAPVGMGFIFTSDSIKALLIKPLIKFLLKNLLSFDGSKNKKNKVIFENNDDLDYFVKIGAVRNNDTCLIRGAGVNIYKDFVVHKKKNKVPIIALVGRMLKDKGIYEYVDAAKILKENNIKAEFLLIGGVDHFYSSSIDLKVLENWNDQEIVNWLGFVNNVDEILKNIDILCLPSYREGLPKALIEGAAQGLPIVTTNTVGCKDVVEDGKNGFLVPIKNSTALARAISILVKDEDLRFKMGCESFKIASKKFASSIIIEQTLEIYNELNS
tara:strand:- start:3719 stop:4867 length:1149 start_codon:yes stop_codon:yes gene_type:complete